MSIESSGREIKTVGVVGLGLLGRGIVACLLGRGFQVIAYTRQEATRREARPHIETALQELEQHGSPPPTDWRQRYVEVQSLRELAPADFVIESIVEDEAIKAQLFDEIEEYIGTQIPIGSNTSALPISILQQGRRHPERFVGMHWGEPCHILRFLEIIRGPQTSDAAFEATVALARAAGKEPSLVEKDVRGFITNRLFYAMLREALHLLESGVADAQTIDRSFRNDMGWWATIAGPFRWMDLTGIPAYAAVMEGLFPELSNADAVPRIMQDIVASGAKGIANCQGFYEYAPEQAKAWEKTWHDFTWDIRSLADKYVPVDVEQVE